ncbi:hypothetical protein IHE45_09G002600 [Dioscorea alata]|uniref:Uncharacterized protein n=1 Tax=Dioscorea alata TaxID=55571 RepID=A0ACB7VCN9_DIOAL|nr:hypothetical protein IHE45_09G002600 [Dioscorea alata]
MKPIAPGAGGRIQPSLSHNATPPSPFPFLPSPPLPIRPTPPSTPPPGCLRNPSPLRHGAPSPHRLRHGRHRLDGPPPLHQPDICPKSHLRQPRRLDPAPDLPRDREPPHDKSRKKIDQKRVEA